MPSPREIKINYTLRPAKQVERKLFIESLHRLRGMGVDISNYHYIGFGSKDYYDYSLFHKYLSIDEMTCVEIDDSMEKRMEFNKPWDFVNLKIGDIGDHFGSFDFSKPTIIWLDFENLLDIATLTTIVSTLSYLKENDILILSLPLWMRDKTTYVNQWNAEFGESLKNGDFSGVNYPKLVYKTVYDKLSDTVARSKPGIQFEQLYHMKYADQIPMLTIGGILLSESCKPDLSRALSALWYINKTEVPTDIDLPTLTTKEKTYLDKNLHLIRSGGLGLAGLPFELTQSQLDNYLLYYKYYPNYQEGIV